MEMCVNSSKFSSYILNPQDNILKEVSIKFGVVIHYPFPCLKPDSGPVANSWQMRSVGFFAALNGSVKFLCNFCSF